MSPIYDYRCDCGEVTEARQGFGVKSIPCPACGREATRLFAYADVHLIGETVVKVSNKRRDQKDA